MTNKVITIVFTYEFDYFLLLLSWFLTVSYHLKGKSYEWLLECLSFGPQSFLMDVLNVSAGLSNCFARKFPLWGTIKFILIPIVNLAKRRTWFQSCKDSLYKPAHDAITCNQSTCLPVEPSQPVCFFLYKHSMSTCDTWTCCWQFQRKYFLVFFFSRKNQLVAWVKKILARKSTTLAPAWNYLRRKT